MKEPNPKQVFRYAIYIEEQLASCWSVWFEGFSLRSMEKGGSVLSGPVADQAALHGLLAKIRDLNLTLIAVIRIGSFTSET